MREQPESRPAIEVIGRRHYCKQPDNCAAGKRGACSVCHSRRHLETWKKQGKRVQQKGAASRALPPMDAETKRLYKKMRSAGVGREEALKGVGL